MDVEIAHLPTKLCRGISTQAIEVMFRHLIESKKYPDQIAYCDWHKFTSSKLNMPSSVAKYMFKIFRVISQTPAERLHYNRSQKKAIKFGDFERHIDQTRVSLHKLLLFVWLQYSISASPILAKEEDPELHQRCLTEFLASKVSGALALTCTKRSAIEENDVDHLSIMTGTAIIDTSLSQALQWSPLDISKASEVIRNHLSKPNQHFSPNEHLSGLKNEVVYHDDMVRTITNCQMSQIYILQCITNNVVIRNCESCTIMLGAVSTILRVENCRCVNIVATCNAIIVDECKDSNLFISANVEPFVFDNNQDIWFAPYNSAYKNQAQHVRDAGIYYRLNLFDQWTYVTNTKDQTLSIAKEYPPEMFSYHEVQRDQHESEIVNPCPLPKRYASYMQKRIKCMNEMMRSIDKICDSDTEAYQRVEKYMSSKFEEWVNRGPEADISFHYKLCKQLNSKIK
ncbi:hypothetical protein AKO1_015253 [Acrasis kona]|uniref:TBCC domain-containing protein 1 n=1 Tax=Acrasis kona TaxID=1008807 RepID=A0AAW2ZF48_9EUKA